MKTFHAKPKLTVRLSDDVLKLTNEAVDLGLASTATAFIEQSIKARVREVRNARLSVLVDEAMADPGFVADMYDTMAAFSGPN